MSPKASAARTGAIQAMNSIADVWALLWSEYQDRLTETETYWYEQVGPAQARLCVALTGPVDLPIDAAAARAIAEQRAAQFRFAMAECEECEHRHELLLDEICRLQETLLLTPAPDEAALGWKRSQLLACSGQVSAETRRIVSEDEDRLTSDCA
jgi:hypothetical protein